MEGNRSKRLEGKRAIVTGGASGFGAGIARRFAEEGARVIVADLNGEAARALAADLGDAELGAAVDVSNAADVAALAETANRLLGGIDIVVNNAGVGHTPQPLDELADEAFDRIAAVNMRAIYLMSKAFVPAMKAQGSGAILNIASTGGVSPRPNLTWYNASKGWVITATRAMAVELAPFQVRVNALNPVAGDTPLLKTFMGADTPEVRAKFLASIPIGRFSTPEDMGAAAAFLCSDDASMITGVALEVDGGRCI
ncbi:4-formylbenzenesulfonate dehydrogenase TsaC1/TsaC2 [Brevundimonas sp. SH203]|uniref:glucose 1-dehydrogenase n=1 Tax=Brevundimonas sp. SH203 TaxID=345167 RepID=UPI0009C6F8C3|nr:glucose 1-dehydrogenase [Brevundimonas sp. SH203]GAW41126.1 4-formylbenzenesulfonate dehydrogenase TsaC1/TsaC2 [Brevundimonas sp. SH203]